MSEYIITKEFPYGNPTNEEIYIKIKTELINTLSEQQFTSSQIRYLFCDILDQFDKLMPVTNEIKLD